eukprot:m.143447 g.143447  ORF g.143447 m.143447 type:complete len:50 (-) comp14096_c1_seq1:2293-2442(-)
MVVGSATAIVQRLATADPRHAMHGGWIVASHNNQCPVVFVTPLWLVQFY